MFTFGQMVSNGLVHEVVEGRSCDKIKPNLKASDRKAGVPRGR